MREGNVRVRERFTLALDGRQIAAIVVGALISLGAVFAFGMQVGQRLGLRGAGAVRPATVSDLEAVAGPPRATLGKELTFPEELPRAKPSPPAPPATSRSGGGEASEPATAKEEPSQELPTPTKAPALAPTPAPSPSAPTQEPAKEPSPAASPPALAQGQGAFTLQLGASQRREEAEALARKVKSFGPRVEEAEIPGKGRFFRIRVGRFESREAAEKARADLKRETGVSGMTVLFGK